METNGESQASYQAQVLVQSNPQEIFEQSIENSADGFGSVRLEVSSEIVRAARALGNQVQAAGSPAGCDGLRLRLDGPCFKNAMS